MISFSPARQASPYQAGTSSHAESFIPQTQEHTGLDELFQMTSCPSAEFTSIVETSSAAPPPPASDVQHGPWISTYSSSPMMGFPVFDPSRIGSEYATPPSYHAPSSYHSHSFDRHSAPIPTMTHPQQSSNELDHPAPDPPASDIPAADPLPPPPIGRPHRATRPPPLWYWRSHPSTRRPPLKDTSEANN
ncbi:hypothetical protein PIB30_079041 [Stylosanthes scabra]|uniref:Uncharacterized protein n=1 Tax=Stylosanthes scabra TaxID=79078 RepID=A0ABU6QSA5_9FABA|nr:hypothetical protein [Stylosanthes scabra]